MPHSYGRDPALPTLFITLFLMSGGSKITDMSKKPPVVAANTATAEASLNVLKTLIDEKLVPDGAATTKDEGVDPNFESGKLVLLFDTAGAQECITVYNKAKTGDIKGFATEIIQIPTPDGKADPYVASFGTSGFVVLKIRMTLLKSKLQRMLLKSGQRHRRSEQK